MDPSACWPACGSAIIALVAAYLIGALPFGLLISRARGVDIRQVGSGNIGATNVFRCVGKPWGVLVFALDLLKGLWPTLLFPGWAGITGGEASVAYFGLACGVATIIGHNWPVYLKFKGGKGVATTTGVLLAVSLPAMLVGLAAWALTFLTTRYVSVASLAAAAAVALSAWLWRLPPFPTVPLVLTALAALVFWRHRVNLQRLRAGTEHRFVLKRKQG